MNQAFVKIPKGIFGFQVQVQGVTDGVALQGRFDFGQQVVATDQEFDRVVEHVQFVAQSVFQRPGQCAHAVFGDVHRAKLSHESTYPPGFVGRTQSPAVHAPILAKKALVGARCHSGFWIG